MQKSRPAPLDIAVDLKQSQVKIKWQDGHESAFGLDFLRTNCPCAVCDDQRQKAGADFLPALPAELDPARPAELVGRYALQFFWADGHRTGIYTFDYLRQLA